MAGKTRRTALVISADEHERLERLRDSRKAPKREVERAAILLRYVAGEGPAAIQHALGLAGLPFTNASTRRWRPGWKRD
ncbi:MAG: hypothetical protein ACHBNF_03360 [Chromatiales bacterium]